MECPEKYKKYLKFARIVKEVRATGCDYYNVCVYVPTGRFFEIVKGQKTAERRQIGEMWCKDDELQELTSLLHDDGYMFQAYRLSA